jgi:signal transduction histidine kinase
VGEKISPVKLNCPFVSGLRILDDGTSGAPEAPQPGLAAIDALALGVAAAGVPVEVRHEGDARPLPSGIELSAYRIVQEALTNVARHAEASVATVAITAESDRMRASITDDGVGFEVGDGPLRSLGLAGMSERASLVGGHVEVVSTPSKGTTVVLEVPH